MESRQAMDALESYKRKTCDHGCIRHIKLHHPHKFLGLVPLHSQGIKDVDTEMIVLHSS